MLQFETGQDNAAAAETENFVSDETVQDRDAELTDGWVTAADLNADAVETDAAAEIETEEAEFKPITARRVEVIHEPEEDDAADNEWDMSASDVFAGMDPSSKLVYSNL